MKNILDIVIIAFIGFLAYVVYKAFAAGKALTSSAQNTLSQLTPSNIAGAGFSSLTNGISGALSDFNSVLASAGGTLSAPITDIADSVENVPALTAQSQSLDAKIVTGSPYAPGGSAYNYQLQTNGQAAADAQWTQAQADYATMESQD